MVLLGPPPPLDCGAFSPAPFGQVLLSSASFWVGRLGLPSSDCAAFLLLLVVLPRKKKAQAQRAQGRKHHYPNEGRLSSPTRKGGRGRQHHPKGEGIKVTPPKVGGGLSPPPPLSPGAASSASCGWGGRSFFFEKKWNQTWIKFLKNQKIVHKQNWV